MLALVNQCIPWQDYLALCKPRVVVLMLLTALVGMYLAPGSVSSSLVLLSMLGIGLAASSAAAVNHIVDRRIDALMTRTHQRPIAQGRLSVAQASGFALVIGSVGIALLMIYVNRLTAGLTFLTLIGYAGVYTGYLKRATPQNIVIGGLAGAAPPLLGWTAVTNHLDPQALLLVLLVFTWTPPHFWALAIARYKEYQKAEIPMLPVTHGIVYTKWSILFYTILLVLVSLFPTIIGMSGQIYAIGAFVLGGVFLYYAVQLLRDATSKIAMPMFRFSIIYLFVIFLLLLIDHHWGDLL